MNKEDGVRQELLASLCGSNAHMTFDEVIDNFPLDRINDKVPNMPYSPWHIVEHMRRSLRDIVAFIQNPGYVSPVWPQGYFPGPSEKTDASGWQKTVHGFLSDRAALEKMAADKKIDLFAPIAHDENYTVFREILVAADHNAYHTGELAVMRQVMEAWPPGSVLYDAE